MKKLILGILTVFISAGLAFSQSHNTTTSEVSQKGDNHKIFLTQVGSRQSADVSQFGNADLTKIKQFSNGEVKQISKVEQKGQSNEAYIKQVQSGYNDYHGFDRDDRGYSQPKVAVINQHGNSNLAKQWQISRKDASGQFSKAVQRGKQNESYQAIGDGDWIKQEVKQHGKMNFALQLSSLHHGKNLQAGISQDGEQNKATQFQTGSNSKATIDQEGNTNYAQQMQDGESYSFKSRDHHGDDHHYDMNEAEIGQNGMRNIAMQWTKGSANEALINQSGSYNQAIQVVNGVRNEAKIYQDGSNNKAFQFQNGYNNELCVSQTGEDNMIMQSQNGSGLKSAIRQSGNNNRLIINQSNSRR